jgi:Protein of unknown function (DUF2934)
MKTNSPTHEEIARRAQEIWQQSGNPGGRDTDIWLEAERQLMAGTADSDSGSSAHESPRTTSESKGAVRLADKESENSGESIVEHHISPSSHSIPDDAEAKAALQKQEARAPKSPTKNAPKLQPAQTSKPLWDKPHSS